MREAAFAPAPQSAASAYASLSDRFGGRQITTSIVRDIRVEGSLALCVNVEVAGIGQRMAWATAPAEALARDPSVLEEAMAGAILRAASYLPHPPERGARDSAASSVVAGGGGWMAEESTAAASAAGADDAGWPSRGPTGSRLSGEAPQVVSDWLPLSETTPSAPPLAPIISGGDLSGGCGGEISRVASPSPSASGLAVRNFKISKMRRCSAPSGRGRLGDGGLIDMMGPKGAHASSEVRGEGAASPSGSRDADASAQRLGRMPLELQEGPEEEEEEAQQEERFLQWVDMGSPPAVADGYHRETSEEWHPMPLEESGERLHPLSTGASTAPSTDAPAPWFESGSRGEGAAASPTVGDKPDGGPSWQISLRATTSGPGSQGSAEQVRGFGRTESVPFSQQLSRAAGGAGGFAGERGGAVAGRIHSAPRPPKKAFSVSEPARVSEAEISVLIVDDDPVRSRSLSTLAVERVRRHGLRCSLLAIANVPARLHRCARACCSASSSRAGAPTPSCSRTARTPLNSSQ